MARDAYQARSIWKDGDLKLIGPPTSTPGLYHGSLYYYLIAPFYLFGQGDPKYPAIFLSLLSSLTIVPLYLLAKDLFKKTSWAFLSSLLFALSFEATQYGPWLSNPNPAMLTTAAFFYSLWLWLKGYKNGLYLALIFAAFSTQFQFFLIYQFVLIIIFKFLFKTRITLKELLTSTIITLISLATFIIATIKFNSLTKVFSSLFGVSVSTQIDFRTTFSDVLLNYVNRFADLFINNFFPVNVFLGGLLGFTVLYSIKKEKFILFCLLSNFLIFIFGGHSNNYVNIGLVVPAILGVIVFLRKIKNPLLIALVLILIFSANIYAILKNSPSGQVALVIPKEMLLKNQLALIDKTYQQANGQPFSINTLTLPLWINTTWAYLYSWYGLQKYGYVPAFTGRNQIGLLGANDLKQIEKPLPLAFYIIEPQVGIPANFYNDEISSENAKTKLLERFNFNGITLEKRAPI